MKSYQPLSCLFSELWTAPRFQVSPRLRKVEGRDQPRGQSLSPEASQEEWWPFWSPERAISSAWNKMFQSAVTFFKLFCQGGFFFSSANMFSIRVKPQPILVVHISAFFYQRKETKKRRYFRCAWSLEFPSSRESNLSIHHLEKGPIFWIRSVYFLDSAEKLTVLKKMDSFCQQQPTSWRGSSWSTFYVSFLFSTHSIFQHENEVILMLPNMARSCYFLSPFDPLNGKSHRLCWKILRSTRSRLPWCKNWCRSRGMRIFPCKPLQEPQIHRVIWWLGRFSITPLVLNCGGESMFFLFFT